MKKSFSVAILLLTLASGVMGCVSGEQSQQPIPGPIQSESKDNPEESTVTPDNGLPESQEELPTTPILPVSEPPVIQASANTYSGTAVLPVKFSCSVSEGVGPYWYSWDFDARDGQQVDKYHRDATFVFAEAGTYRVTLTVTDSLGQEVFDTLDIEVFPQEVVRGSPVTLINQHGTDENPIVIEGLEISTTEGNGINLIHCSHVIIRNNFIHDLSSQEQHESIAIRVQDSSYIDIHGNYLVNNHEAMYIWATPEEDFQQNIRVWDNVVLGTEIISAINIGKTKNIEVYNNFLKNNGNHELFENGRIIGIYISDAMDINIHDNISIGCTSDGIGVSFTPGSFIENPEFLTSDFTINNNTSRENGEQGIWLMGVTKGRIFNNYLEGNTNANPRLGSRGIMLEFEVSDVDIFRNVFVNNEVAGIDINMSYNISIYENYFNEIDAVFGGIWIDERPQIDWFTKSTKSHNNIIKSNVFHESRLGIKIEQGENTYILNNTFYGNGTYEDGRYGKIGGILVCEKAVNTLVKNNIIVGNRGIGIYCEDSDHDISYNNVWNNEFNYSSGFTGGMGNISEDPLFVSPENGNFTLQPNSPCRGAGLWDAHLDIDNSPSGRIDMGAFIGPAN